MSVATVLVMVLAGFAAVPGAATDETIRVVVTFKDKVDEKVIKDAGGKVVDSMSSMPVLVTDIKKSDISSLMKNGKVKAVELDQKATITRPGKKPPRPDPEPDDTPPTPELQWGVDRIDAEAVWLLAEYDAGVGITVAILDTGVDKDHPELSGALVAGYDIINDDDDPDDDNGHGTHCAGIVAAAYKNSMTGLNHNGVVGVAHGVSIMPVKVLDSGGSGTYTEIADGIIWAADHGADVISMSLSGRSGSTLLRDAIRYAIDENDVVVVAAAGNAGKRNANMNNVQYPAKYPEVIAVGATDSKDARAKFSSTGTGLDVVAPGVTIWSTNNDGKWKAASGTSMACPHVAGTVGLVLSNSLPGAGSWTPELMHAHINASVEDLGANGRDSAYGYGLVDTYLAVTGLSGGDD